MSKTMDIEKEYENLQECIAAIPSMEEKIQSTFISTIAQALSKLCIDHKSAIRKLEECEDFNDKHPYHYSEQYMADYKNLKVQLAMKETELTDLKSIKAKELGEAISIVVDNLTDVISQKLETVDIIEVARHHNAANKFTAIDKLEKILLLINHINDSPDNERIEMFKSLATYIQGEIDDLKGDK